MLSRRVRALIIAVIGMPVLLTVVTVGAFYVASSHFAPNRVTGSIQYAGKTRDYLLYVPPTYSATRPTALVISLHAAAWWPNTQAVLTQWNELADRAVRGR
ncbi:MAG: hypothetical protein U0132_04280 [Gemmatimonadaceae bacterium]